MNTVRPLWLQYVVTATPLILLLALDTSLLLLSHAHQDDRGVWTLTALGFSLFAMRDVRTGPVLWVYTGRHFQGHWAERQWHPAAALPDGHPLTSTPYPPPAYPVQARQT